MPAPRPLPRKVSVTSQRPPTKALEHLTSRHANRILIEGDPLSVRLARPRRRKAAR
jgi:hypothetical protein